MVEFLRVVDKNSIRVGQWNDLIQLFIQYHQFYKCEAAFSIVEKYLSERLNSHQSFFLLAIDAQQVLGFAHIYPIKNPLNRECNWILYDLFVTPFSRGKKISSFLLQTLETLAIQERVSNIQLTTAQDNVVAQSCYVAHNYKSDNSSLYYNLTPAQIDNPSSSLAVALIQDVDNLSRYANLLSGVFSGLDLELLKNEILTNKILFFLNEGEAQLLNIGMVNISYCSLQMKEISYLNLQLHSRENTDDFIDNIINELLVKRNFAEINIKINKADTQMIKLLEAHGFTMTDQWVQYILPVSLYVPQTLSNAAVSAPLTTLYTHSNIAPSLLISSSSHMTGIMTTSYKK